MGRHFVMGRINSLEGEEYTCMLLEYKHRRETDRFLRVGPRSGWIARGRDEVLVKRT